MEEARNPCTDEERFHTETMTRGEMRAH
jgi:hypothetical protein